MHSSLADIDIEAFPGETRQVVLNLARNACEATAEGSTVCVRLGSRGAGAQLEVIDQGSGLSAEVLPNLFDFGRTTKGDEGNGLGLWTVKQIVMRHGGSIHADTQCQGGARFVVWWPKRHKAEDTPTFAPSSEAGGHLTDLSAQTASLSPDPAEVAEPTAGSSKLPACARSHRAMPSRWRA